MEEAIAWLYQLDADARLRTIIGWRDSANGTRLEAIQDARFYDPDTGVKMAALKRIHLFDDKENVRQFLLSNKTKIAAQECEPYYSLALSRTGIIAQEEFKRRLG